MKAKRRSHHDPQLQRKLSGHRSPLGTSHRERLVTDDADVQHVADAASVTAAGSQKLGKHAR